MAGNYLMFHRLFSKVVLLSMRKKFDRNVLTNYILVIA